MKREINLKNTLKTSSFFVESEEFNQKLSVSLLESDQLILALPENHQLPDSGSMSFRVFRKIPFKFIKRPLGPFKAKFKVEEDKVYLNLSKRDSEKIYWFIKSLLKASELEKLLMAQFRGEREDCLLEFPLEKLFEKTDWFNKIRLHLFELCHLFDLKEIILPFNHNQNPITVGQTQEEDLKKVLSFPKNAQYPIQFQGLFWQCLPIEFGENQKWNVWVAKEDLKELTYHEFWSLELHLKFLAINLSNLPQNTLGFEYNKTGPLDHFNPVGINLVNQSKIIESDLIDTLKNHKKKVLTHDFKEHSDFFEKNWEIQEALFLTNFTELSGSEQTRIYQSLKKNPDQVCFILLPGEPSSLIEEGQIIGHFEDVLSYEQNSIFRLETKKGA